MAVETRLAEALVRRHPDRAAAVLERATLEGTLRALSRLGASETAEVVAQMSPFTSAKVLDRFDVGRIVEVVNALELAAAARLVRGLSDERRDAVIERLSPRTADALGALLRFPEHSAGALMDPEVQALAEDLTAEEALRQIRESPDHVHYNLYVVDRRQVLVGALNLRELFLAPSRTHLADLMVPHPFQLRALASRAALVAHPGWKVVHSLPVADDEGVYVGAVRYATLRSLENELFGRKKADVNAGDALGGLFATGASGLLEALTLAARPARGR